MMHFVDAPFWLQGLIGLWVLADFYMALALLVILEEKKWFRRIGILPVGFCLYMVFQCIESVAMDYSENENIHFLFRAFAESQIPLSLLFLFCITIWEIRLLALHLRFRKQHLSSSSVKEAIDTLPAGICCYEDNGQVILKNSAIDDICQRMTGRRLLNGVDFASKLNMETITLENRQVLLLDEHVFQVEAHGISGKGRTLLTAVDITEEYRKYQNLFAIRRDVQNLNEKLYRYNKEITSIITQRERLNAKIQIHDCMGKNLLFAKHYILNGGSDNMKQEILQGLNEGVSFLLTESDAKKSDPYERIFETAERLNTRIVVSGELPADPGQKQILATAMHECLTNVLRHAAGDEVYVSVSETNQVVRAIFTDNGKQPIGSIIERGGLKSLRKLVEAAGGSMKIEILDSFQMTISLPKEKKDGV